MFIAENVRLFTAARTAESQDNYYVVSDHYTAKEVRAKTENTRLLLCRVFSAIPLAVEELDL
jgi:hypothetical protein